LASRGGSEFSPLIFARDDARMVARLAQKMAIANELARPASERVATIAMGNAILAGQTVRGSVGSASRRSHAAARVGDIPAEINSALFRAGDLTLPEEEQLAVLKMAFFAHWPTVHPHPPARPPRAASPGHRAGHCRRDVLKLAASVSLR